jgi:hypothetical protein
MIPPSCASRTISPPPAHMNTAKAIPKPARVTRPPAFARRSAPLTVTVELVAIVDDMVDVVLVPDAIIDDPVVLVPELAVAMLLVIVEFLLPDAVALTELLLIVLDVESVAALVFELDELVVS